MEEGRLNKKEQIEIIISNIRKYDNYVKKITNLYGIGSEIFDYLYDIGYKLIPEILGISQKEYVNNYEILDEHIYDVMNNHIDENEFFAEIEKYLKED